MASRDLLKTIPLVASTANLNGQTVELSSCSKMSLTVLVSVSAATLSATVQVTGTNDDARASDLSSVLPTLNNGVVITGGALPGTVTYTNGVLAFANLAIGTYEVTIDYPTFPKWARVVYTYTSGGGTVDLRATLAVWSV